MRTWTLGLVVMMTAACFATAAGCGPGDARSTPQTPAPPSTASAPAASASASVAPIPSGSSTVATQAPPPAKVVMKPIAPSQMAAKLRDIGLDPAALPPLNKLDPKMLRDVMNTFTKSLGVQCSYCHEKDFKAPTAKKTIATHMWNDFTRSLAIDGGALYCDSCHGGRTQVLDRTDLRALGAWMQENYVDKTSRVDKKDHGCETCHGDPFEGKILTKRWK